MLSPLQWWCLATCYVQVEKPVTSMQTSLVAWNITGFVHRRVPGMERTMNCNLEAHVHDSCTLFKFTWSSMFVDAAGGLIQPIRHLSVSYAMSSSNHAQEKSVWIWTENKQVMATAVERGWHTFIFPSGVKELANEWSSIAKIVPLFINDGQLYDSESKQVAILAEVSSSVQLQELHAMVGQVENIVINCLDWQVCIPS
eukprot:Gb_37826 [translate_table: standard]